MLPNKRTKTPEECEANAMLLGGRYIHRSHCIVVDNKKIADPERWICAETLQPISFADYIKRLSDYQIYEEDRDILTLNQ